MSENGVRFTQSWIGKILQIGKHAVLRFKQLLTKFLLLRLEQSYRAIHGHVHHTNEHSTGFTLRHHACHRIRELELLKHFRTLILHGERHGMQSSQLNHQQLGVLVVHRYHLVPHPVTSETQIIHQDRGLLLRTVPVRQVALGSVEEPDIQLLRDALLPLELVHRR
uniref:(northern house mosquito) hypothetical protein n=1 Tax=Culex pipiens TaxID=7175 RepID=A0A8D8EQJ1_CULPI